jgi:hypothetical protein
MSSTVKGGGIAGVVAAALLVLSVILNQLTPVQTTYDSAASYLYLAVIVAAYVAVLVALLGIHAVHRGRRRYGRLGTVGTALTFAGYAIIATSQRSTWCRDSDLSRSFGSAAHWSCSLALHFSV